MTLLSENSEGTSTPARAPISSYLKSPWAVLIACLALTALLDPAQFPEIVSNSIRSLSGTAPYIIFAVLLIASLKATGSETLISEAFKGRESQMIILASFFGGLAPFCSCEVIPFIAGLIAAGAPLSAIMAFWLSSPLVDPPTIFITAGALGWPFAVGKALSAVAIGLIGGFSVKFLMALGLFKNPVRSVAAGGCGCGPGPFKGAPVWKFWTESARVRVFKSEALTNALFLAKWLSLAYVLQALMVAYIPADLIAAAVGGEGIVPIAVAALVGMPAYLNGYIAPPMLAGLIEQGMSPGAAMSFMVAGAVSCIPAMAAVWALVKPGLFGVYLGFGFIGAILTGLVFSIVV